MRVLLLLVSLTLALFANTMVNVVSFDDVDLYDVRVGLSNYTESAYTKTIYIKPGDVADDGTITFSGGLDSNLDDTSVDKLYVEVSVDGGDTWHRAEGHANWQWKFTPDLNREYDTMIRVVQLSNEESVPSNTLSIGGFSLVLEEGTHVVDGLLNGNVALVVPYLDKISTLENRLPIRVKNLHVENNRIVSGQVEYNEPIVVETELLSVNIRKIIVDAVPENSTIEGSVTFKGVLSSIDDIELLQGISFLPNEFSINLPFDGMSVDVWSEKDVAIEVTQGSLEISYHLNDNTPKVALDLSAGRLHLGTLLTDSSGTRDAIVLDLQSVEGLYTTLVTQEAYLLDTGMKLAENFELSLDLSRLSDPKIGLETEIDLTDMDNVLLQHLQNPTITATASKVGFSAHVSASGVMDPITIINRGDEQSDVRLRFTGDALTFDIAYLNGSLRSDYSFPDISAEIYFGDLLQSEQSDLGGALSSITATLNSLGEGSKQYRLALDEDAYLMGSGLKLPSGMTMNVDLQSIEDPKLSFKSSIDLSGYEDPLISHMREAEISATMSKDGFRATVTTHAHPDPIVLMQRGGAGKDVEIVFDGDLNPSFELAVSGSSLSTSLSLADVKAHLNFGDLLNSVEVKGEIARPVTANIAFSPNSFDDISISFRDFPRIKLLESALVLSGLNATLDLQNRAIAMDGVVDLDGYDNPIYQALSGATFQLALSPERIEGEITVQGGLEPIVIVDRGADGKDVTLRVSGEPRVAITVTQEGVAFNLASLNASLDLGDLLQTTQGSLAGHYTSVVATLQQVTEARNSYAFSLDTKAYLLGSDFAVEGLSAVVDLDHRNITWQATARLDGYENPLLQNFDGAHMQASVTASGLSATLTKEGGLDPIVVMPRGGAGHDVSLVFTETPKVNVQVMTQEVSLSLTGGQAELDFGDLLEGTKVSLAMTDDARYRWSLSGKKKLLSDTAITLEKLRGVVDLRSLDNPSVTFDAEIDLSGYGSLFSSSKQTRIRNAKISKEGMSLDLTLALDSIDIYKEESVKMTFLQSPQLHLDVTPSGINMGFSKLEADINFGTILDGSIAHIGAIETNPDQYRTKMGRNLDTQESEISGMLWSLSGEHAIAGSDIMLSGLSGSINIDDINNPTIMINANVDLSNYGSLFKYVRSAAIEEATISKDGFKATFIPSLQNIEIYKDKNVYLSFAETSPPKFSLKVAGNGVKVGLSELDAALHFGSMIPGATAKLRQLSSASYEWRLDGKFKLGSSEIALEEMQGLVDLSDLKDPNIGLQATVNLSGYETGLSSLHAVSLSNATVSKRGFQGDLSAALDDISIWQEKQVKLNFTDGTTPTLHLSLLRSKVSLSLSYLDAQLDFGKLLDGEKVTLAPFRGTIAGKRVTKGVYSWSLSNAHTLVKDNDGNVTVNGIGGVVDLQDFSSPRIVFSATADFSNYHFDAGHIEIATLEDAKISSSGIDWNLVISGAGTEVTILDLGTKDEDVRLELANVGGTISNAGANITGADGILYFGALFNGNVDPITLSYDEGSSSYSFSTPQVLTYKHGDDAVVLNGLSGVVSRDGGSYKVSLNGNASIEATLLSQIGLGTISIGTLEVSSRGFKGDITSTWAPKKKISLLNDKIRLELSEVGVAIDSSQGIPISLIAMDGDIDVSELFEEASNQAKAVLSYSENSLSWQLNHKVHINKFAFDNLGGTLAMSSMDSVSVAVSGQFTYTELNDVTLALENFSIRTSGLYGTVRLAEGSAVALGTPTLKLTALSATFGDNISGSAAIVYDENSFLGSGKPMHVALGATVDRSGIRQFSIESDSLSEVDIDGFAKFTFTNVTASPSLHNFWINLDGTIQPDHAMFSASNGIEFQDLNISHSGVSIASADVEFDVSGADASLGGLDLSLEKAGIGFDQQLFYLSAKGGLSLMGIEAGAGVKLFSDKHLEVDSINVLVNKPGLSLGGEIAWYENDEVYGNGFSALGLHLRIAGAFSVRGAFQIGKVNGYLYWLGQAQGGTASGIPLGPLTIYELGGGVAYNMKYTDNVFIPERGNSILILSTLLGTPDIGFVWHGQLDLHLNTSGQINLIGDTYVLSKIGEESQDRKISGKIEMGFSPATIHIAVDAKVTYHVIGVDGQSDIMLSPSEKHIYIGTDDEFVSGFNVTEDLGYVTVTAFGYNVQGYFMVDTRQLAFGMAYSLDEEWEKDWTGCNPKLSVDLNARADALMRYKPFFMKIGAAADAELEGCYCACIDIDAHVLMELGAPDPNYLYAEASVSIDPPGPGSVSTKLSGYVYGSGKDSANDDAPKFLDHIEPYAQSDLSVMPQFKVLTMPITGTGLQFNMKNAVLRKSSNNHRVQLEVLQSRDQFILTPSEVLQANTDYVLEGDLEIVVANTSMKEHFSKDFKTTEVFKLTFDEVISEVVPANQEEYVSEDQHIELHYSDLVKVIGSDHPLVTNYSVAVKNAKNEVISGSFTVDDNVASFEPTAPMRVFHYCVNSAGETRETFLDANGAYRNPFNGYRVDGDYSDTITRTTASSSPTVSVPTRLARGNVADAEVGEYVSSSEDESTGEVYSYFTNRSYKIIITDVQDNQVAYYSTFDIQWNNRIAAGVRQIEHLEDIISPKLLLHIDEDSRKQIRLDFDPGLYAEGINGGVGFRITTLWDVETDRGPRRRVKRFEEGEYSSQTVYFDDPYVAIIPGSVTYYERAHPEHVFFTKTFALRNDGTYSSAQEEEIADTIEHSRRGPVEVVHSSGMGVRGGFGSPDDAPDDDESGESGMGGFGSEPEGYGAPIGVGSIPGAAQHTLPGGGGGVHMDADMSSQFNLGR